MKRPYNRWTAKRKAGKLGLSRKLFTLITQGNVFFIGGEDEKSYSLKSLTILYGDILLELF